MIFDKFHEECGVAGVHGNREAANLVYLSLYSLQHRGQEGAGIAVTDRSKIVYEKGMGLVADIFSQEKLDKLQGDIAIGHNRYSTTGVSALANTQPITVTINFGQISLAHNGNIVNADEIKEGLVARGAIFGSTSDSEVIVHLIAKCGKDNLIDAITDSLRRLKGAFSLLIMTKDRMIGVRDAMGMRPLVLGKLKNNGYILASETVALDLIEASFVREIEPGEMVIIDDDGIKSIFPFEKTTPKPCIFEHIYFARPDSYLFGRNVYEVRKKFGRWLAKETPVEADVVIPVPDSGVVATLGYAEASGIPFEMGLMRNHYVGRTFIEPSQSIRHFGVKIKLNPVREVIDGKRVVVVDDSIVRGTTSRKIVKMLREAGAKEVHMRISSPPTAFPCFYGIDTPTRKELIASTHTVEETRKYITADSLGYLSIEGLMDCVGSENYCHACFSGEYPTMHKNSE
ncbi:amidophosphoribosyltransferase [Seleniivibrio woodruffii]|uniref:Amidophosphoribosyltransferase n=1 Tax=Seleniivibrio woodruffii TaxID=1078050 RepID=A0A4R1K2T7_9BACT|nr:amidophosphoribosyltransferase [Seleniivibrio woodruffii]TCK58364.1 amidophosphoribosyltransferase [Seleniivibrio woodruffii]TVZ36738.1 amidophosphoribosyltransferase [Seleniivibrio woodruffii]